MGLAFQQKQMRAGMNWLDMNMYDVNGYVTLIQVEDR